MTSFRSTSIRALMLIIPVLVGGYIIKFLLDSNAIQEKIGVLLFFVLFIISEWLWIYFQESRTS